MVLSVSSRKALFLVLLILIGTFSLAACSSDSSTSGPSSAPTTSAPLGLSDATAQALKSLMTFIGKPMAKMVSGTTFEVDGQVKNGDSKQHDIYVTVELLDASGKVIASSTDNVDNVAGGTTENYSIQGTTPQPDWSKVEVFVAKVTENINGSGTD